MGLVAGDPFRRYAERFGRPIGDALERVRAGEGPEEAALELGLPTAAVTGPASFFADLSTPKGPRHVRACGAAACFAATSGTHAERVRAAIGGRAGTSVQAVHCLGYCYAAPAALDGNEACVGPDAVDQLLGTAPRADPPIPWHSHSREPVVMAGLAVLLRQVG